MRQPDDTTSVRNFTVPDEVTCLSLDIWNTLLKGNRGFTRPRLALIFELLGKPGWDVELLRDAYRKSSAHYDRLSEVTGKDFGMADRLQEMYSILGINETVPDASVLKVIQGKVGKLRAKNRFRPRLIEPDLVETLTRLRDSGYRLGLLSNTGMDDRRVMKPILKKLGIWHLCEVAVFSSEDGRAKPNPDLFRHMADLFEVEPAHVLHVGDNVIADFRAHEAGLHSVVYAPAGNDEYPSITSMKELLKV